MKVQPIQSIQSNPNFEAKRRFIDMEAQEQLTQILRKMDKEAEKPGMVASLVLGIMGSLLLGIGMCCTMIWNNSVFIFAFCDYKVQIVAKLTL